MPAFPHKRIIVIGATGSGKSTLAERLAQKLHGDFIELDALHWEPNWTEATLEVFRERVRNRMQAPAWVVAGNYSVVRDLVWSQAQAAIWLDYSFPRVFSQLTRRTFRRWWNQEELWNGNREKLWWHFKLWSDESLFKWLLKTYWRRKREYPQLLAQPEYQHIQLVRFTQPAETEEWFNGLSSQGSIL
jgi:adenylate kinase family enzyme